MGRTKKYLSKSSLKEMKRNSFSFLIAIYSNICFGLHDKYLNVASFSGYKVHRCHATTQEHLDLLDQLGQLHEVELWTDPSLVRYLWNWIMIVGNVIFSIQTSGCDDSARCWRICDDIIER